MQKMWKLAMGGLLAASLVLAGCGSDSSSGGAGKDGGKKLKIVTTFYPMYEFSKQVAGDNADVTVLVPGGTEPHDWEPTPKDIAKITDADVFVYNGAGFESWVPDVLGNLQGSKVKVVEATKDIPLLQGGAEDAQQHVKEHKAAGTDPHVWLDPVLAQQEVANIAAGLAEKDSAHADQYKKNAEGYAAKLKELDASFQSGLASAKGKEFVTAHQAFGYLAKRYSLTQEPIAGLDPEQEPSAAEMANIVKFAKEHQVKTIFFETLVSPKVAETVAREIGAKTDVLNPLEGLTEEEKAKGLDYVGVMKGNLEALKKALQ
jgi:zinc transport system substrate-binding protein